MWPYRFEVKILIRRPPVLENTISVYGVVTAMKPLEAEVIAAQMACVFHPSCEMPMYVRVEEITEGVQWE